MAQHSGMKNAHLGYEAMVFFCELSNTAKEEGQDRFADLFWAPLFDSVYVDAEANAIASEHNQKMKDSRTRTVAVLSSPANCGSALGRFHRGSEYTVFVIPQATHLVVGEVSGKCPNSSRIGCVMCESSFLVHSG